jgi:hypothetical protein
MSHTVVPESTSQVQLYVLQEVMTGQEDVKRESCGLGDEEAITLTWSLQQE